MVKASNMNAYNWSGVNYQLSLMLKMAHLAILIGFMTIVSAVNGPFYTGN
jgi:hypothetical protein